MIANFIQLLCREGVLHLYQQRSVAVVFVLNHVGVVESTQHYVVVVFNQEFSDQFLKCLLLAETSQQFYVNRWILETRAVTSNADVSFLP